MSIPNIPRGPGLFKVTQADGETLITNVRRLAGADRTPAPSSSRRRRGCWP